MEMLHKRLIAFAVFQQLTEEGLKVPAEDPSDDNRKRWTEAYNQKLSEYNKSRELVIPLLVIWTTNACTLRCRYCGNYIPLMHERKIKYNYQFDNFCDDINRLMGAIDGVHHFVFAGGGEPLLTANFEFFIENALSYDTIHMIAITTNGSVMPSSKLLSIIEADRSRFIINIDNYESDFSSKYISKRQKVASAFENVCDNINYQSRPFWIQTSPIQINHRNESELTAYYEQCMHVHAPYFTSIWDGKLYTCPRHGIYQLLGYNVDKSDYVDLRIQDATLRDKIISFFSKQFFYSCNYCNNVEDSQRPLIKPGEQIRRQNT